jgi:hypothetical protein
MRRPDAQVSKIASDNQQENESMSQQKNQEWTNQAVEIEDLTVEEARQNEVKGSDGGIQKLGSRRLILQNDGTYS